MSKNIPKEMVTLQKFMSASAKAEAQKATFLQLDSKIERKVVDRANAESPTRSLGAFGTDEA